MPGQYFTVQAKGWLGALGALGIIDGYIWTFLPNFTSSNAYSLANRLLPQQGWGLMMLLGGVMSLLAALADGKRWAQTAARVGLTSYACAALVIGLSIFALTLDGTSSALTGATKWWAVAIGAFFAAFATELRTEQPTFLGDWLGIGPERTSDDNKDQ